MPLGRMFVQLALVGAKVNGGFALVAVANGIGSFYGAEFEPRHGAFEGEAAIYDGWIIGHVPFLFWLAVAAGLNGSVNN